MLNNHSTSSLCKSKKEYEVISINQNGSGFLVSTVKEKNTDKEFFMYSFQSGNEYFMNLIVKSSPYLVPMVDVIFEQVPDNQISDSYLEVEILRNDHQIVEESFSKLEIVIPKSECSLLEFLNGEKVIHCNESDQILLEWVLQLIKGVKSLHEQGFVHRNIIPFHIHIYSDEEGKYFVKLGGTWSSCQIGYKEEPYNSEIKAPEIRIGDEEFDYLPSLDIYSLGITISQILERVKVSDSILSLVNSFIDQMTSEDPEQRPTIDDCFWFFKRHLYPPKPYRFTNKLFDCFIKFSQ
ncbi:predicted protein [Naegleria gruberi]|uniref:Predicted protein n=1 Tax=Naegleria gruberi TaxID=5762 RepID=D2W404_NAEGR|nr:uncharacterized protein NAEGRDRAFT_76135 [Naegleria gruberi]EFC36227.1 predicted protein [Naegleria gruberi]|eukprot:XP_002668971.1 predicted protein [Naegleria gruberi strain NEG-M]